MNGGLDGLSRLLDDFGVFGAGILTWMGWDPHLDGWDLLILL